MYYWFPLWHLGALKQPAGRGMSKQPQSITRTHQAPADGGMLQVKHSEEALGGSDNMAPSRGPEGYLLATIPSTAPHVFSISRAFPQARVGPSWAELRPWLGPWQGFERSLKWHCGKVQNANVCVFCVAAGSELGGSGGAVAEQQLHCGAAGGDVLGTGASEELQGVSALQHQPEQWLRWANCLHFDPLAVRPVTSLYPRN